MYVISLQYCYGKSYSAGGVDYGDDSINVEFPAGSTRMCVNISITDDSIPESEEGFEVDVGPGPDVSPTPVMTTVLILDNGTYK